MLIARKPVPSVQSPSGPVRLPASGLDLGVTLRSGQFFRYRPAGEGFEIVTHGRRFTAVQRGSRLDVTGTDAAFARRFFGLDGDPGEFRERFASDALLREAVRRYPGLRILRQDPWECTLAFICSACSNIPRITRNLDDLARFFGRHLPGDGPPAHALPRPGGIADGPLLRRARLGWRARYVKAASDSVSAAWLESLRNVPLAEARRSLQEIPGVGAKVAGCILLFSLGFGETFPVDVWIRRTMRGTYPFLRRASDAAIEAFALERYGSHAGLAQQYIYMMARGGSFPQIGRCWQKARGVTPETGPL